MYINSYYFIQITKYDMFLSCPCKNTYGWDHWAHWGIFENGVRWAHCGIFESGVLLMYTLEGVSSVANFISAYEESQLNEGSHFLIRNTSF